MRLQRKVTMRLSTARMTAAEASWLRGVPAARPDQQAALRGCAMLAQLAMSGAFQVPSAGQACALPCGLHAPERVLVLADAAVHNQQLRAPGGRRINGHCHVADARCGRRIAGGACRQQAASSAAEADVQCV